MDTSGCGDAPFSTEIALIAHPMGAAAVSGVRGTTNKVATEIAGCTLEPGTQFFILRLEME